MYKLVISGDVNLDNPYDESIKKLLEGEHCTDKFEVAVQEMMESASNVSVTLTKLDPKPNE